MSARYPPVREPPRADQDERRGGRLLPRRGADGDLRDDGPARMAAPDAALVRAASAPTDEPGPRLWSWTYAVSQKVRNLERDPRTTLQVETGELYQELRGVMLECEALVREDLEVVKALGHEIFARYASPRGQPPAEELPAEIGEMVDRQAPKRVALEFVEVRRVTWDHRKLGGAY